MKTSAKAIDLLAQYEQEVDHVYKDQAGLPTIGCGHLLTRSELLSGFVVIGGVSCPIAEGITHDQCMTLMAQDLAPVEATVNAGVKVHLEQNQFDALMLFCFNIGNHGFLTSSALTAINNGKFDEVPADIAKWNKITQDGLHVVSQGLVNRRNKEIALWNGTI